MRIAFVTVGDKGRQTGGYFYNARLSEGLRRKGDEVVEITPCGVSAAEQLEASDTLHSALDPEAFDVMVVDALARVLVSKSLDSWRERRPVVAMVHELPSVAGDGDPRDEGSLLSVDRLVAVSRHGSSILRDRGVPAERIHIVPPGFDRLPAAGYHPYRRATSEVRVLCVAQWIPRKGIVDLIEAWSMLESRGAVLELIGETDVDPEFTRRVRRGIETSRKNSIVVRGVVDDGALAKAYAAADVFVLPSTYEGYGIVYTEALANGLPVIACRVGPVPELVGEASSLLVPPQDPESLSAALDALISNPEVRHRMSDATRHCSRKLPSWRNTVEGFQEVLQATVAERGRLA